MQQILNTPRSSCDSQTSWQDGNTPIIIGSDKSPVNCFRKANAISLENIFKYYNVDCGEHTKKIVCPFKSHNGGNESTASFYYYPKENNFWCFGCKIGVKPVDFVSEMEQIEKIDAAHKIIEIFNSELENVPVSSEIYEDKLKIMMSFSNCIRAIMSNSNQMKISKIEKICKVYDDLNHKHSLNCDALSSITDKLLIKINNLKE